MKLLLDTHAFLWWDASPEKLSNLARQALEDEANEVYLSLISIWEIQIKTQLGKLNLRNTPENIVAQQKADNNILILPLIEAHIYTLDKLPHHHKDPFDRILIAQAINEGFSFVTDDALIQPYAIPIFW